MNVICIIPARMGSSRFPGKPMKEILGKPMIGHVWERCKKSKLLNEVYVATCDQEIFDYIQSVGGKAIMTKDSHERCTERTSEALLKIEAKGEKVDIVVMVQGDEPMTEPEMLDAAVEPMIENKNINVVNLMSKIENETDHKDPNTIKVVLDNNSNALYFSRMPIPTIKDYSQKDLPLYKQVCIIPFRRDFLVKFDELAPTKLEVFESIDMMRVLEHGDKVHMVETTIKTQAVDTMEDLKRVEKLLS